MNIEKDKMYILEHKDYLELWKYFSDDAVKVKDKLWTISIWLFALMGSVLGFIMKYMIEEMKIKQKAQMEEKELLLMYDPLILIGCGVGLVLTVYAWSMINSYGKHIRAAWNRTIYLRSQITGMNEVWLQGYKNKRRNKEEKDIRKETNAIPTFVVRILWFVVLFGVAFVGLGLWYVFV